MVYADLLNYEVVILVVIYMLRKTITLTASVGLTVTDRREVEESIR